MNALPRRDETLRPGTPVEVFIPFNVSWMSGFEVSTTLDDGYELRRLSDRAVLPKSFSTEDVRPQHPRRRSDRP